VDCVCEKSGNTRGVISEMETCSLACADIKETFLSRKNNMHHAWCLLCARILSAYSTYIMFFYCREYAKSVPVRSNLFLRTMVRNPVNSDNTSDFSSLLVSSRV